MTDLQIDISKANWCGAEPSAEVIKRAEKIQLLLMDVDGVLTNGLVYFVPAKDGSAFESKGFSSHDGMGFHLLNACGIKTGFISGRESEAVRERAANMKVSFIYEGFLQKEPIFDEILQQANLKQEQVAYMGDDFTDIPLIKRAGLGIAVANAREEVKKTADFITEAKGGEGAMREIVELILKSQNKWTQVLKKYL
jgi:3-deoxy-D-manno-octulosonate 8-phosphate phosphatase (KDO 8-P phosphatase)